MLKTVTLCLATASLAIGGCSQSGSNDTAPKQTGEAKEAAGSETIAASLDQNGKFFQAAKAVGLDATLAGPGPYTVLIPADDAFATAAGDALADPANPQNRAQITRIITYHVLPGVILSEDIGKAIDNGDGKAMLATMGGETITATKEGGKIVLTDGSGGKATLGQADEKHSNGVVHHIDAALSPGEPAASADQSQGD
ncbi:MAG TPA: fasciclin domain-containing protein [Sphingomicrobium sp.]|nr:fasciclin domain-containing protein [Sphingomicrobium sp.]